MKYPQHLIEADLLFKRISAHARREKSIRPATYYSARLGWKAVVKVEHYACDRRVS